MSSTGSNSQETATNSQNTASTAASVPIDDDADFEPGNIEQHGNPYADDLRRGGINRLLRRVWRRTKKRNPGTFSSYTSFFEYWHAGACALASIDTEFIQELIGGNFPQRIARDRAFRRRYDEMVRIAGDAPKCYGQWLMIDHPTRGLINMTPRQLMELAALLRKYLTDIIYRKDADKRWVKWRIDDLNARGVKGRRPDKWKRKFTNKDISRLAGDEQAAGSNVKWAFPQVRYNNVAALIDAIEQRFAHMSVTDPEYTEPVSISLTEIGYAIKADDRLDQHASGHGSNYVMTLALRLIDIDMKNQNIKLVQQVIYPIFDVTHASLGEIIFTEICLGYVEEGYGFSHHGAGTNNWSGDKAAVEVYTKYKNQIDVDAFVARLSAIVKARQDELALVKMYQAVVNGEDIADPTQKLVRTEGSKHMKLLDGVLEAIEQIKGQENDPEYQQDAHYIDEVKAWFEGESEEDEEDGSEVEEQEGFEEELEEEVGLETEELQDLNLNDSDEEAGDDEDDGDEEL